MKNVAIIVALSAGLVLAGCAKNTAGNATVGGTPAGTQPAPNPSKVRQIVTATCGFLPTLTSVASVISASPFVPAAGAVADAICDAVTTLPLADGPGDRKPRVNGVVIEGRFVR